ncbi:unnamed protein product [Natator depressus]
MSENSEAIATLELFRLQSAEKEREHQRLLQLKKLEIKEKVREQKHQLDLLEKQNQNPSIPTTPITPKIQRCSSNACDSRGVETRKLPDSSARHLPMALYPAKRGRLKLGED